MKLYIPDINDILKLKTSWSLSLQHNYVNEDILRFFGCKDPCNYQNRANTTIASEIMREEKIKRILYD